MLNSFGLLELLLPNESVDVKLRWWPRQNPGTKPATHPRQRGECTKPVIRCLEDR